MGASTDVNRLGTFWITAQQSSHLQQKLEDAINNLLLMEALIPVPLEEEG